MASLSGILQRPVVAAAAVTAASLYTDLTDKLPSVKTSTDTSGQQSNSTFSCGPDDFSFIRSLASKLAKSSYNGRIRVPVPNVSFPGPNLIEESTAHGTKSSFASCPLLLNAYRSAGLTSARSNSDFGKPFVSSSPDVLYRWHLPEPDSFISENSRTVVVLLGWLGSKQRHLRKYAEWYTSQGFHVITFTFPMSEILSYQVGGKAEQEIESLVKHLADWLDEEHGKNLIFHTFSNTGWLMYGAILEDFQKQNPSLIGSIKGCIVDSAPVAAPDPQVWASGFSAAFLKKESVAAKTLSKTTADVKPGAPEAALLAFLEKFFSFVLNLPSVKRRLSDVIAVLSSAQPTCPQLYIYSSADRVIPVDAVESFIDRQRKAGLVVRSCDFGHTPHVDHFRNNPELYTSQVSQFLDDCVLSSTKK